jgi:hypothetical protein
MYPGMHWQLSFVGTNSKFLFLSHIMQYAGTFVENLSVTQPGNERQTPLVKYLV